LGLAVFVVVVTRGNYLLAYYQMPLLIPASFIIAGVIEWVFRDDSISKISRVAVVTAALSIVPLSLARNVWIAELAAGDQAMLSFARHLDDVLPGNSRVVTLADGNPTFLYHIHRKGWVRWPGRAELNNGYGTGAEVFITGRRPEIRDLCRYQRLRFEPVVDGDSRFVCVKYEPL
jgi:hypothetical protein